MQLQNQCICKHRSGVDEIGFQGRGGRCRHKALLTVREKLEGSCEESKRRCTKLAKASDAATAQIAADKLGRKQAKPF